MGIRICPDCGGKVSDSRKDCIHCGYVFPVTKQCPDCGESVEENAKVCPECGYAFEVEQTTGVSTASVAPTVQTNESEAKQTSNFDETTPVVCPQCGSNDIELKSSELGKCRSCGTTVVLPKKEQQVNVVNNFVVSNNAENSANYYTIKPERTLRDEFIREAYISLAKQRITPVDIADSKFDVVKDSVEQYIEVDSTANITYSATIGYDRQVEYTDYDSTGQAVKKTKTVTDWKPFSGSLVEEYVVFVGNDDKSMLDDDFKYALKSAKSSSVVPYDGTSKVNVAPLPPSPNAVETAKRLSIENAEFSAENNLPGNHYKDFYAAGSATVNSVNSYTAPRQSAKYTYGAQHHECSSFAFGNFRIHGTCPDDSKSIHTLVEKKTNPLLWTSLALAIFTLIMSIVACTCNLGSGVVGGIIAIVVPMIVMAVMFVVSLIMISKKYKKLISQAQYEKVERTNAKLRSLKLKPMTQEERAEATAKSSQSMLTKKRNPLRTATIILCVIMLIAGTICTFIVNDGGDNSDYGGSYGSGNNYGSNGGSYCPYHIYTNNCDATCNVCGAIRTISHTYDNACDTNCNECGAIREIEHTYSSDCDTICNVCEYERVSSVGHTYDNTCDTICNDCGAVREIEHTYSSDCDTICNVCGATRTTSTAHSDVNPADNSCDKCGVSVSTLTFTLSDDGQSYAITDANSNISGDITIPSTYDGKPVTTIGKEAFYFCTSLTSITIPDSVTTIGDKAFLNCKSLTSIVIPDSVTNIGDYAFYDCNKLQDIYITDIVAWCNISGLYHLMGYSSNNKKLYINNEFATSITIPDSVTSIGNYAFYRCIGLTSVTIGGSVTSIGGSTFFGCYKLVEVYNKSTLNIVAGNSDYGYVGYYALNVYTEEGGSKLSTDEDGFIIYTNGADKILVGYTGSKTDLIISDGIKEIYECAFAYCDSLTSIVIPDSVTSIGYAAFEGCTSLTSVVILDSVTTIGSSAFEGCTSLTNITIPDSVTSIGSYAFYYCTGLTSIVIPDSVTSIGYAAFSGCTSLTDVYYLGDIAGWCGISFESNANLMYHADNLYIDGKLIEGELIIPGGVTTIGEGAFSGCSSLTSITIPDSVTTIGEEAFRDCDSLTSITIPASVTGIGKEAFSSCDNLTSVTIGDSVTTIGQEAFYNCTSLTDVYYTSDIAGWCGIAFGGASANPMTYADNLYIDGKLVEDLVIPDSVTSISDRAFEGCTSLTSVTIPDSVTSIGYAAFYGCTGLTSVTIGGSVTSIGDEAFSDCTGLTSVTIGGSVTTIGSSAFYNCRSLTSVVIPGSVTSIGYGAFYSCNSLTSIVIPDSVTAIGNEAFSGCTSLTSITFKDTTTWYMTTSYNDWQVKTGGTITSVTDPSTNVTYFTSTHVDYYWYKE